MTLVLNTTHGLIHISLFCDKCPRLCENFLALAASGEYDDTEFHRVVPGSLIHGGKTKTKLSIWGPKFEGERIRNLQHDRAGRVTMIGRPNSTQFGTQFMITLKPLPLLDGACSVFGEVTLGLNVVESINSTSQVKIESITILENPIAELSEQ